MNNPKRRKQFTFYASYYDAIQDLPVSRRYETLDAMILYALYGKLPTGLKGPARGVFRAIQPNLDSSRVKAETALRKMQAEQEGPFSASWEEQDPEPWTEQWAEPDGGAAQEAKKKKKFKYESERENERENEREKKKEKEGSAARPGEGGRGDPAPAGDGSGLSLPEREMKKILSKTPLIAKPPYDAMFRQDPMLIYYWKDAAGPGGEPLSEAEQRSLLTELLSLPVWERPAHLNDRIRPQG